MSLEHFIKQWVVDGKSYTSDEVKELISMAWIDAVNEQVQLEMRCANRGPNWLSSNCKKRDYHFLHHHDCPPPDRGCVQNCVQRCYHTQHIAGRHHRQ